MEQPREEREHYTAEDYWALTEDVRTELIDGRFYDMAPPTRKHQGLLMELSYAIRQYIKEKGGGCKVYPAPFGVQLKTKKRERGKEHVVEPDISVICDPKKLTDRGCDGAPDWIIEIVSPSDPGRDYVLKLNLYIDAGVREYWIVDPMAERVMVYWLNKNLKKSEFAEYNFQDAVPVGIYGGDLRIDFAEMKNSL